MKGATKFLVLLAAIALMAGCASMGATNSTSTNTAVTAFEGIGSTLTSVYNTEAAMVKAGTITAAQDNQFQGLYKQAYNGYQSLGAAMQMAITATGTNQTNAQAQVTQLMTQLPTLVASVTNFMLSLNTSGGK